MKKKIISIPSAIPGCTNHYDSETGKLVGYSMPGLVSGVTEHFSADGSDLGYSVDGLLGGRDHYDENGRFTGFSTPGIIAGADLFDASGSYVGGSVPNAIAGSTFCGDISQDDTGIFDGDPFDEDQANDEGEGPI